MPTLSDIPIASPRPYCSTKQAKQGEVKARITERGSDQTSLRGPTEHDAPGGQQLGSIHRTRAWQPRPGQTRQRESGRAGDDGRSRAGTPPPPASSPGRAPSQALAVANETERVAGQACLAAVQDGRTRRGPSDGILVSHRASDRSPTQDSSALRGAARRGAANLSVPRICRSVSASEARRGPKGITWRQYALVAVALGARIGTRKSCSPSHSQGGFGFSAQRQAEPDQGPDHSVGSTDADAAPHSVDAQEASLRSNVRSACLATSSSSSAIDGVGVGAFPFSSSCSPSCDDSRYGDEAEPRPSVRHSWEENTRYGGVTGRRRPAGNQEQETTNETRQPDPVATPGHETGYRSRLSEEGGS
ncbi:uncharacterized protein PSFLO_07086 [Pseudozyma flocculosa]|uniref:Uncharacterized protein n=1 Tax=Pseudozyma flocculosa TaxID=84751 RepID=A0A5C3FAW9_9BASI|nr:uncharacterized protein PSFLO_07086 [Pseudozyma flocculosa]